MAIEVSPEIQAMIDQDVARGPYESAQQFVEEAIRRLHAEEEWFAENREEISAKIEEGWAAIEREELLDEDEVRRDMEKMKREWFEKHKGA